MMSIAEKLTTIAENVPKVYEAGKNLEYNRFWDTFQDNGNRTNYDYAFGSRQWVNSIMNPKYPISATSATRMFLNSQYKGDLSNFAGGLDFSKSTSTESLFGYAAQLTKVGIIDISASNNISGMFTNCSALIEIEKLVFKNDGSQTPGTSIFQKCYALQNIVIDGVIGKSISFGDSTKLPYRMPTGSRLNWRITGTVSCGIS